MKCGKNVSSQSVIFKYCRMHPGKHASISIRAFQNVFLKNREEKDTNQKQIGKSVGKQMT